MILIMLFHQYFTRIFPFNFFHNFGHWGVDIFLFLSGMGMVKSLNINSLGVFYKRRFLRLFPSCVFCGTAKYTLSIIFSSSIFNLLEKQFYNYQSLASLDLWFIPTIIILYSIAPALYTFICKWPLITIKFIVLIFFLADFTLRPLVSYDRLSPAGILLWTNERLPVFSIGMYICIYSDWIDRNKHKITLSLLFAVILRILEKVGVSFPGIQACQYLLLAFGVPTLIRLCIFILKKTHTAIQLPLIFIGSHSLEIYLVHEFIFHIFLINNNSNPWIVLFTCLILSCISAHLCKMCTNKIKAIIS